MTRDDYDRISARLGYLPNVGGEWLDLVVKCKEIEVLQEISESLKSMITRIDICKENT